MRRAGVFPRSVWCAAVLAAATLAPALAAAQPRIVVGLGATMAPDQDQRRSGLATSLSALFDYGRLEFGPSVFADDLGSQLGRLTDPNDQVDLGAVALGHRFTYGGAWRLESPLTTTRGWTWRGMGTWGYYRVQDDRLGVVQRAASATGWSLGLGVSHRMGRKTAIGVSGHYHGVGDDSQDHYSSATVDLMWLPEAAPSRAPRKATSQDGH